MAISTLQTLEIIEAMENFLDEKRPPEHLREQVDLMYKIEGQSVLIYEVRPVWNKPGEFGEYGVAKATYVNSNDEWKVYWLRSNQKWYPYTPHEYVSTLKEFADIVLEDKHHCFFG
jgi:Protein of unknown function (DUF3024)